MELDETLAAPQHEPGFFARRVGIELEEERRCLEALARAGQIRKRGGRWRVRRVLAIDTRQDPARNRELKMHWARVGLTRLTAQDFFRQGLASYNLFAVSEDGLGAIRAAHLAYFDRLRAIVASTERPTRVVLANVQLVPLDGPPGE